MTTDTSPGVEITPAGPEDLPFIQETIERLRLDPEHLDPAQFITLRRDGRIVAFGRIKPYQATYELGSVAVVEEARGHGLGEAVVRELVRSFPQDEVYITTDLPAYFERMGFLRTEILPSELEDKIARVCDGLRPGTVGMIYDRRIEKLPGIADVYRAKHVLEGQLPRTPLLWNPHISRDLGCDLYIKYENLLPIGAFKVRGGAYLASTLTEEEKRRGIIGASTGNHGQSLAYGAKLAGARCVIAMPEEGNPLKVESMRALGAEVEFHGANFEEARGWAEEEARREGLRYVHHVNSPELITGVATMSLEIMEDLPDVEVIVSPIGGGSGAVGHCLVAKGLRPDVQVIGVQAAGAPAVYNSWRERKLQRGPIHTHAEGLATGHAYCISVKTFIDRMDDMLLVSEDEIGDAVVTLARFAHQVAEDSGAAAMAGAIQAAERLRGKKVAVILSGGNMTLDGLRRVLLERAP
ncbi:MAG TPA: pyridoxal-phosphate dependent enzyme [Dehalococcoidia bacterium]|nr:pyridoxal-phosphate dependent enzyme [Dehalococcoidia bacterium]